MCFIALFFHKLLQKEATDSDTGLKLTDLLEKYIFPQSQVMLGTRIGKSVFGTVYKGYAHKILPHENETLVAIKEIKGSSSNAASLIETQKVDFAQFIFIFVFSLNFYDDLFFFIFLDVFITGIRIKGYDAMPRTSEFG